MTAEASETRSGLSAYVYRTLRYTPNLVRDEWLNIGVLVFDARTGERRLRMIEGEDEYARVRRLHPQADEGLLRELRNNLEDRLAKAHVLFAENGNSHAQNQQAWMRLVEKWDQTLSNALQLAEQKATYADDLEAETERLYKVHVAVRRATGRPAVREAVRQFAPIACRSSGRHMCGSGSRKAYARRNSLFPAIRCGSIIAIAGTARGGSYRRLAFRGFRPMQSCWLTP